MIEKRHLDFSEVFNDSFAVFKKALGTNIVGLLILAVVAVALYMGLIGLGVGFQEFSELMIDPSFVQRFSAGGVYYLWIAIISLGIQIVLQPISAGFIDICRNAKKNRPMKLSQMFGFYRSPYFVQLAMVAFLVGLTLTVLSYFFDMIGFTFLYYPSLLLVTTMTSIAVPLVIYKDLSGTEAISQSIAAVSKNFLNAILLVFVGSLFAYCGAILCGIGIIVTYSFSYALQYTLYDYLIGDDEKSEIDEIGISLED